MSYFLVNHSVKHIYKLINDYRQTFDDILDENPTWNLKDNVDYYEDDVDAIQNFVKMDYSTNLSIYELPVYIQDPEFLVWYMDSQGFGLYDISRAIKYWDGKPEFKKGEDAIEDLIAWKEEQKYMSGEDDMTGYADTDELMLCEKMQTAM